MTSTQTDTSTAKQTASTAADEVKHLGSMGTEEAKNVAAEAKNQVRTLMDETTAQVNDQSIIQRDRLVSTLQTFSSDLDDMANRSETSGLATELAHQAAQRARDLGTRLDGREPSDLLDEVRGFARRRPGVFLLGAVAAGVVVGRMARGAKASSSTNGASGGYPSSGVTTDPATGWESEAATTAPTSAEVPRVASAYSAPYAADYSSSDPALPDSASPSSGVHEDAPNGSRNIGQTGTSYGGTL